MAYTAQKTNSSNRSKDELASTITGWGADLDPKNRPGVPKERKPPQGTGAHWVRPERQIPRVKILKSTEHREITPVFGTACPPKGLSGLIRTYAYKYSEGKMAHWFLLMFADRVDVVESAVKDLFAGNRDKIISEMGLRAEWTRHGIRSRIGENRADVGNRYPKQVLFYAGMFAIAYGAYRYMGRSSKQEARSLRKVA